jgi:nucleotidyltransferase/DNA polymerase involved in DNA repair
MIFDRYIVHVDMDMFYAACEKRENPSLSGKIFAVGGNSMLSTANYEARKYGIRAGMPGFIGKVLARKLANSELILVPCNFELYKGISKSVQEVFADYDPNFSMLSLDEGYLDFTEHLRTRADKSDFEKAIVTEACDTCGKRYLEITEMRLELKFFGEKIDESKEKFHKFERKDQKSIDFESVCDVLG